MAVRWYNDLQIEKRAGFPVNAIKLRDCISLTLGQLIQTLSHLTVTASSPEAAPPLSFGHSPNGGTFTKGSLCIT